MIRRVLSCSLVFVVFGCESKAPDAPATSVPPKEAAPGAASQASPPKAEAREDAAPNARFRHVSFALPEGWTSSATEAEFEASSEPPAKSLGAPSGSRCGASTLSVRFVGSASKLDESSTEGTRCKTVRRVVSMSAGKLQDEGDLSAVFVCEARGEFELGTESTVCDSILGSVRVGEPGAADAEGLAPATSFSFRPKSHPDLSIEHGDHEFHVPGRVAWRFGTQEGSLDVDGDGVDDHFVTTDLARGGEGHFHVALKTASGWRLEELAYASSIHADVLEKGDETPVDLFVESIVNDDTGATGCTRYVWKGKGYAPSKGGCPKKAKRGRLLGGPK